MLYFHMYHTDIIHIISTLYIMFCVTEETVDKIMNIRRTFFRINKTHVFL